MTERRRTLDALVTLRRDGEAGAQAELAARRVALDEARTVLQAHEATVQHSTEALCAAERSLVASVQAGATVGALASRRRALSAARTRREGALANLARERVAVARAEAAVEAASVVLDRARGQREAAEGRWRVAADAARATVERGAEDEADDAFRARTIMR